MLRFLVLALLVAAAQARATTSVLFIGNSFTYGAGSAIMGYRPELVHDLNGEHASGIPALFKALADQLGLDFDVSLETGPGRNFDWHWTEKRALLDRHWDVVVLQAYSVLDAEKPGDATQMSRYGDRLAKLLRARNPKVELNLMATWSRADQTYPAGQHWSGQPITAMAKDLQQAYDQVAQSLGARRVIPVGLAWNRAIESGLARANPYDPAAKGLLLWADDYYHASAHGSYLEALTVLGALTGCDPRLGEERVAHELGITASDALALQEVASKSLPPTRCCPLKLK
ncbi:MAG: PEP-CTERM sorting domain-containing protein [Paucibacter sp.]|nr:PEP-CTERM sorting domain-containing protein [Roseateles sp.]